MLPRVKIQDESCHAITNLCSGGVYESLTETLLLKGHKLGNGVAACLGFIKKVLIFSVFIGLYKKAAQPAVPNRHHSSARFGFFEITGQRQVKLANAKIETDFSFGRRETIDFRMRFARRPSRFGNEACDRENFERRK